MFGKISTFVQSILMATNAVVIALMLFTGLADRINPESHPVLSTAGHAFPVFVVLNFLFLIIWIVIVRARNAIIPVLGFLVCYSPMRTYCPLNLKKETPKNAIKMLSFNVMSFGTRDYKPDTYGVHPALRYVLDQGADIVCLQESPLNADRRLHIDSLYQYVDTAKRGKNSSVLLVMSRYPIVKKEHIDYQSNGNLSAAFHLKIGEDTLVVVNNHLETSGLSCSDRAEFSNMVQTMRDNGLPDTDTATDTIRTSLRRMLLTLGQSAKKRAPQARAVSQYIKTNCGGKSVIVCGDFNDGPLSYTRRTISKGLTDCYVESANGPGWSYNENNMKVRIDNIMCSKDLQPYACAIDKSVKASDHFPIVCWLAKRDD